MLVDIRLVNIYIYNSLNTLPGGKSCLVAPGVAVPPWATETVLSSLVGGWWGQGIACAFTRCMMKKKIYGEIIDFGESDKIIKICGKMDKSNTYNGFSGNISFFINKRNSLD